MLSEIKNLCKRLFEWLKTNNKELYLAAVIILVAVISFGLGRLSKIREEKKPITIEMPIENASANLPGRPALGGESWKVGAETAAINSQKIFVASRNGKKYYYAWCESANVIKEQNRVWFATKEEAEKAGYQPAANCRGLK